MEQYSAVQMQKGEIEKKGRRGAECGICMYELLQCSRRKGDKVRLIDEKKDESGKKSICSAGANFWDESLSAFFHCSTQSNY